MLGGALKSQAACYVVRQADRELLEGLLKREFCYVLTSRQRGKSSIMIRAARELRAAGFRIISLDLTRLGQNLSPPQWYLGLLDLIGESLGIEEELPCDGVVD